jgi:hypothetical protein
VLNLIDLDDSGLPSALLQNEVDLAPLARRHLLRQR